MHSIHPYLGVATALCPLYRFVQYTGWNGRLNELKGVLCVGRVKRCRHSRANYLALFPFSTPLWLDGAVTMTVKETLFFLS